jgi:hypothetical protein
MRFRGGEFSTGTMGNFQPELTQLCVACEFVTIKFAVYGFFAEHSGKGGTRLRDSHG